MDAVDVALDAVVSCEWEELDDVMDGEDVDEEREDVVEACSREMLGFCGPAWEAFRRSMRCLSSCPRSSSSSLVSSSSSSSSESAGAGGSCGVESLLFFFFEESEESRYRIEVVSVIW